MLLHEFLVREIPKAIQTVQAIVIALSHTPQLYGKNWLLKIPNSLVNIERSICNNTGSVNYFGWFSLCEKALCREESHQDSNPAVNQRIYNDLPDKMYPLL